MNELRSMLAVQVDVPAAETTGDFHYRSRAPSAFLAKRPGTYVVNLTNEHRHKASVAVLADVLVLNMLADVDWLPLIRLRRARGRITVYEWNDDVFHVPPSNPRHGFYSVPRNRAFVRLLAEACDAVQFSSPALLEKYGSVNERTAVFPNHVAAVPPDRRFRRGPGLVVGWGGSAGHYHDMAAVAGPLGDWLRTRPGVELRLMCSEEIRSLFDSVPESLKKRAEPGSLFDYYRFLEGVEAGIGPLLDTPFNRSRSDVKYLEYAARGIVPVMQECPVYGAVVEPGINGLLFGDARELVAHLDRLREDWRLRIRLAQGARARVMGGRLLEDRIHERATFYEELVASGGARLPSEGSVRDRFESCCALEGARRNGRHLILSPTPFELLLRRGLYALEGGELAFAERCFEEAASLEPASYLPHLYLAGCPGHLASSLAAALERNPRSLMARLLLENV